MRLTKTGARAVGPAFVLVLSLRECDNPHQKRFGIRPRRHRHRDRPDQRSSNRFRWLGHQLHHRASSVVGMHREYSHRRVSRLQLPGAPRYVADEYQLRQR